MSTVKKILIIAILTIVAVTAVFIAVNIANKNDNPEHQLALAYKLLENGKYEEAIIAFNKVIDIDGKNIEAHIGLSRAYVKLEDYDEAEKVLNKALEIDNKNKDVYEELIGVYELTNKYDKISDLIEDLEGIGLSSEADKLRPNGPTADLASGTYSEPIEIALSGSEIIYYTTDGSEPTSDSLRYNNKIKITSEGTHQVKAMVIDNRGINSKIETFNYVLAFEQIKAPTSSLYPGTYTTTQSVRLGNPNGKGKILYSINGEEPNLEYNGAIKVTETTTIKARCYNETTGQKSELASWKYDIENKQIAPQIQQPSQQQKVSPFVDVTVQSGTGYTMKKFFTDLFGFNVELSDMRGVGIQIDESAWTKEVSQSEWNSWLAWRKTQYGY